MSRKPWAIIGEVITCTNNHIICEVVSDIIFVDKFVPTYLGKWRQDEPQVGTSPVCKKCGALFWHGAHFGNHFHFTDGWRDIEPPSTNPSNWLNRLKRWLKRK
jgi:hypothetical protein